MFYFSFPFVLQMFFIISLFHKVQSPEHLIPSCSLSLIYEIRSKLPFVSPLGFSRSGIWYRTRNYKNT
jgi:hypothetical protein